MTSVLHLDFDGAKVVRDRVVVSNSGRLPVEVRVSTAAGGSAVVSPRGDGRDVLRLPRLSSSANPPRAVLLVEPDAAGHKNAAQLGPGGRDFRFGATFLLDRRSEGAGLDNGNNLVQRGLSGDPAQYKLQVDHGHASCRVAGDQGSVVVRSRSVVRPRDWYSATCSRIGRKVTLALRRAGGATERMSATGTTGFVVARPDTPLTIGGKAYQGHVITGNSDQFNGEVREAFLDVRLAGRPSS